MDDTKTLFEIADEVLKVIQNMNESDWIDVNALWAFLVQSDSKLYVSMSTDMFLLSIGILIEKGYLQYQGTEEKGTKYFFMVKLT